MVLELKTFYCVSATVFTITFAVTLGLIEIMKPDWALQVKKDDKKKEDPKVSSYYRATGGNGDDKDKKVNHTFAVVYSLVIALTISVIYAVAANSMLRGGDKLDPMVNTSLVIIAVFLVVKIFFFFNQPDFIKSLVPKLGADNKPVKDDKGKDVMELQVNMMKENGIALALAVIAGIGAHMMYKKNSVSYIAGNSFGSQKHYKMSFPMKQ